MRHGFTLIEQLLVLCLLATLLVLAVPSVIGTRDRTAVRTAARAVRDALALAREQAVASGSRAAVRFDAATGSVVVHAGTDSLLRLPLGRRYAVQVEASRDSTAYLPSGLGAGAANVSIVLRRGAAAETVTVSRLGRVR
jgi:prepilin-type N-terminal cleavage/methylation domain-containing protein